MWRMATTLIGRRFGRLLVTARSQRRASWVCACDCGTVKSCRTDHLVHGKIVSCGCYGKERTIEMNKQRARHGRSHEARGSAYASWRSMRDRCNAPNNPEYSNYGGRGIRICQRWDSFKAFVADMGERPPGTSIDRIDVNGNYEPGNCRWATSVQQNRNRRTGVLDADRVREILGRHEHGESQRSVSRRLGIASRTVYDIIHRRRWADVSEVA